MMPYRRRLHKPFAEIARALPQGLQRTTRQLVTQKIFTMCHQNTITSTGNQKQLYVFLLELGNWKVEYFSNIPEKAKTEINKKYDCDLEFKTAFHPITTHQAISLLAEGYIVPSELPHIHSVLNTGFSVALSIGFVWMLTDDKIKMGDGDVDIAKPFIYAAIGALCFILLEVIGFILRFERRPWKTEMSSILTNAVNLFIKLIFSVSGWLVGQSITKACNLKGIKQAFTIGAFDASFTATICLFVDVILKDQSPSTEQWVQIITLIFTVFFGGTLWSIIDTYIPYTRIVKSIINAVVIFAQFMTFYGLIKSAYIKMCRSNGGYVQME